MNCPQCNVSLVMSAREGVEIDYCPQCRGVWLDRGELDKIIERSDRMEDERPTTGEFASRRETDRRDYDRGDHYKHHKRKSFWHELFD